MEPQETRAAFERLTSGTKRVLLVGSCVWFREALAYPINRDPGLFVVQQAGSLEGLREDAVDHDVILTDLDPLLHREPDIVSRLSDCSFRAPLLALTGSPDLGVLLDALEGGADMLLSKSASVAEIISSVKLLASTGATRTRRGRS